MSEAVDPRRIAMDIHNGTLRGGEALAAARLALDRLVQVHLDRGDVETAGFMEGLTPKQFVELAVAARLMTKVMRS